MKIINSKILYFFIFVFLIIPFAKCSCAADTTYFVKDNLEGIWDNYQNEYDETISVLNKLIEKEAPEFKFVIHYLENADTIAFFLLIIILAYKFKKIFQNKILFRLKKSKDETIVGNKSKNIIQASKIKVEENKGKELTIIIPRNNKNTENSIERQIMNILISLLVMLPIFIVFFKTIINSLFTESDISIKTLSFLPMVFLMFLFFSV